MARRKLEVTSSATTTEPASPSTAPAAAAIDDDRHEVHALRIHLDGNAVTAGWN
jgi:hypothetical protein